MDSRNQMWINGEFTSGVSGRTIDVLDPATEEVIERVPAGNANDAARAVDAASAAFADWRRMPAGERGELLHEVARKLTERTEALAELLTREGGKPLVENRDEMGWSAACFRYYAEIGRNSRGRVIPSVESSQLNLVLKEPYGVVGDDRAVELSDPADGLEGRSGAGGRQYRRHQALGDDAALDAGLRRDLRSSAARGRQYRHRLRARGGRGAGARSARAGDRLHRQPGDRPAHRAAGGGADQEAAPGAGRQRRLHRRGGRRSRYRGAWRCLGGAAQRRPGLHLDRARLRAREHRADRSSSASPSTRAGCAWAVGWSRGRTSAR